MNEHTPAYLPTHLILSHFLSLSSTFSPLSPSLLSPPHPPSPHLSLPLKTPQFPSIKTHANTSNHHILRQS
ncbi:hypothetical protein HanXRQr2_Chr11g0503021 [Helianthus annuus]|uniref:Uncharacterized protein n=1 Tax=Helianthus annuus TaxID=4232 RepID=A0A9K3N118_HELAN|nr:hypothetical protein HanXRQr2_Chr11g0503021 [Helianthus annuus]KAJ0876121.1 hypothetical protein HanPSC8_Chr11g0484751 [Helianthus annuus]